MVVGRRYEWFTFQFPVFKVSGQTLLSSLDRNLKLLEIYYFDENLIKLRDLNDAFFCGGRSGDFLQMHSNKVFVHSFVFSSIFLLHAKIVETILYVPVWMSIWTISKIKISNEVDTYRVNLDKLNEIIRCRVTSSVKAGKFFARSWIWTDCQPQGLNFSLNLWLTS